MRWIADTTGRFGKRPFYTNDDMESECEGVVSDFLIDAGGEVIYPLSTDDLTLIVERFADLDLYANLCANGDDVQGVTSFVSGKRPAVRIDERLSTDERRRNRLRTTLAHEFGHVRLHDILFQEQARGVPLFGEVRKGEQQCRRDGIANPSKTDWLEFQAGYVSTALLAPKRRVLQVLARTDPSQSVLVAGEVAAEQAARTIAEAFEISLEAARIRLQTVGALGASGQARLF
jgi:Zn-dependent peptidase ImmA (M78 family)